MNYFYPQLQKAIEDAGFVQLEITQGKENIPGPIRRSLEIYGSEVSYLVLKRIYLFI